MPKAQAGGPPFACPWHGCAAGRAFASSLAKGRSPRGHADPGASRHVLRLAVRKQGRIEFVAMADLVYAQGADNYVELVLAGGRRELFDHTLTQLAAMLPDDFQRIHKSYLVRLSAVRKLHVGEGGRYRVELTDGTKLPVGRTRYHALRKLLGA